MNDVADRQCVYLGPFCDQKKLIESETSGEYEPFCQFSHMANHGYELGSKYYILNYLSQ